MDRYVHASFRLFLFAGAEVPIEKSPNPPEDVRPADAAAVGRAFEQEQLRGRTGLLECRVEIDDLFGGDERVLLGLNEQEGRIVGRDVRDR